MPIIFDHTSRDTRYVIRACSPRLTIINASNHKVMREIDFASHDAAMFFVTNLTT